MMKRPLAGSGREAAGIASAPHEPVSPRPPVGGFRLRVGRIPQSLLTDSRTLEFTAAVAAAGAASAGAMVVLKLWQANLRVPFAYSWDANFNLMLIKGILDHGWWFRNPDLGAPFGQQLYDFALGGDNLHLAVIRLIGSFTRNPALAMNLFYVLSFPLSALSAYAVLRWARVSRPPACACAILFALTPYVFIRGERHLFLAADYGVPLGCYLALAVWSGRPLFERRPDARSPWLSRISKRTLLTIGACVVVASTGNFYYGSFAIVLVGAGALVGALVRRSLRPLAAGGAVIAVLVAVMAANLAPTLLYASAHGRNYVVASRQPGESDVGGLKLTTLILPIDHHRLQAFARLAEQYDYSATPRMVGGLERPSLGAIASAGFLWLFAVLLTGAIAVRRRLPAFVESSLPVAGVAGTAFLVGTTGGVSSLIAYLVTPQLRAWNRISIFIAFLSLVAIGLLIDAAFRRFGASRPRRTILTAALAALVALGVFDQTTPDYAPAYSLVSTEYRQDAQFARAIEQRLGGRGMIYELPYIPFPEWPAPHRLIDYDLVRPYLHSSGLHWSYGAMKGRPQDWQPALVQKPVDQLAPALVAAGFSGIYLDRFGFRRRDDRSLEQALARVLRARPLVSTNRRFVFFDLRPFAARLQRTVTHSELVALRAATLTPPRVEARGGVWPGEELSPSLHGSWWFTSRRATLDLYEPGRGETVVFRGTFANKLGPGIVRRGLPRVWTTWPGGARSVFLASAKGVQFAHRLHLRHGDNLLRIRTNAPQIFAPWDSRTLYLQLVDARFDESAFALLEGARTAGLRGDAH